MSMPYSSTMLGISSSPPATPRTAATARWDAGGQADDGLDWSGEAEAVGGALEVAPHQRSSHQHQQACDDLVQGCGCHPPPWSTRPHHSE
jgi:hypothetical protein